MKTYKRYFFGALLWAVVADLADHIGASHFEAIATFISFVLLIVGFALPVLLPAIVEMAVNLSKKAGARK